MINRHPFSRIVSMYHSSFSVRSKKEQPKKIRKVVEKLRKGAVEDLELAGEELITPEQLIK